MNINVKQSDKLHISQPQLCHACSTIPMLIQPNALYYGIPNTVTFLVIFTYVVFTHLHRVIHELRVSGRRHGVAKLHGSCLLYVSYIL